ncbi:MAG TPA: hypothetical protein VGM80_12660 [Gaiellaceae bacterium]
MAGEDSDAVRAAVLEVVERFFGNPETKESQVFGGPLLALTELAPRATRQRPTEHRRTLESAEIVKLSDNQAVVQVHATFWWKLTHGSWTREYVSEGPAVLERVDGSWRIFDYMLGGVSRRDSIAVGELALQHRNGASVRVLALDRNPLWSAYVIELTDTGAGRLALSHAYSLVEADALWSKLEVRSHEPVPEGGSRRIYLASSIAVPRDEPIFALALDVRAGTKKLPFVLRVPPEPPDEVVAQRAPRRLPHLRRSWPRNLAIYAAITAGTAWWYGWLAILVPIYLGLHVYWQVRRLGVLPSRLRPIRYAVDAGVVAASFLVLWESPAVYFALPFLVAAVVYFALVPIGSLRQDARVISGVVAGLAFLFVAGTSTGRFSPCRVADGSPAGPARSFAVAVAAGDVHAAAVSGSPFGSRLTRQALRAIYTPAARNNFTRVRAGDPAERYCKSLEAAACYRYGPAVPSDLAHVLLVGVGCDGRSWHIDSWI